MAPHLEVCLPAARPALEKSSIPFIGQGNRCLQPKHVWKPCALLLWRTHKKSGGNHQGRNSLRQAPCALQGKKIHRHPSRRVVCSAGQHQNPGPSSEGAAVASPTFPTIPAHVHTITSPSNTFVKHCIQIRQSRSYRDEANSVLVVGGTPLREICEAALQQRPRPNCPPIKVLFLLESWTPPPNMQAERVVRVNEAVMRKLAGVETAQRIEAVGLLAKPSTFVSFLEVQLEDSNGRMPGDSGGSGAPSSSGRHGESEGRAALLCSQPSCYMAPQDWCPGATRVVALDGIQDPGNLGTLLRTALAFNWDSVFLLPGCCDPFNDKALRSSRGAVFRLRLAAGDWTHFESICATRELVCYGGDPEYATYPPVSFEEPNGLQRALHEPKMSLVLGNESNGLSSQARRICRPVAIPMAGDMESLNVAVAGGILMYLLRPDKS